MTEKKFIENLSKIKIFPTKEQLEKLHQYYELIIKHNKVHNLTRIIDKSDVYLKHFYDSLTLNIIEDLDSTKALCDIGSGAGFPGVVLKIIFPTLKISLVDSLGKRTKFLKTVIKELNLKDIEVFNERGEDHSKDHRESYDLVTARAVAQTPILLELGIPLLKVNGNLLLMKTSNENLEESKSALQKLDSKIEKKAEILLPISSDKRMLIKIKKTKKTKKQYPRNYSQIKKKTL